VVAQIYEIELQLSSARKREKILLDGIEKIQNFHAPIDLGETPYPYRPENEFDYGVGRQTGINQVALEATLILHKVREVK
jgi:hypothetical protein